MATTSQEYTLERKTGADTSEEIQIPASSVSGLANVATSGSYNDLSNKPTIPTDYVTTNTDQEITGKKTFKHKDGIFIDRIHNLSGNAVYDYDGTNVRLGSVSKPAHIRGSEARPKYESPSGDGSGSTVKKDIALVDDLSSYVKYTAQTLTDAQKSQARSNIGAGTSSFSGNYNDLSNKPTIPAAANNGTLTIQKNGTSVATFGANQSTNATANITVPTNFDDLTRIKKQGYAGDNNAIQYFKLASFPTYNSSGNYASFIITGRMGGWQSDNMSFVNMILYNRGAEGGGYINVDNSAFYSLCDVAIYRETNGASTAYLKVNGYYTFDINVNTFQATNVYTGTAVTPTGTLKWTASSQADRLAVSDGKAYINGFTMPKQVKINGVVHNPDADAIIDLGTVSAPTPDAVKSVIDYNDTSKKIKIGYAGTGISGDGIKYIAGYTAGDSESHARIKDISKDALKSWLGYATVATSGSYNDLSDKPTIPSGGGITPFCMDDLSTGTFSSTTVFDSGLKALYFEDTSEPIFPFYGVLYAKSFSGYSILVPSSIYAKSSAINNNVSFVQYIVNDTTITRNIYYIETAVSTGKTSYSMQTSSGTFHYKTLN